MNIDYFLAVLKARWYIAALVLLLTVATTFIISRLLQPNYTATAQVVLDTRGYDLLRGGISPEAMMPTQGAVLTQVDIMKSEAVAKRVVRDLKIAQDPGAIRYYNAKKKEGQSIEDFFVEELLAKFRVIPSRESRLVDLQFTSPSPAQAAVIANAFARAYLETVLELRTRPARDSVLWYQQVVEKRRQELDDAQRKLSQYQQETGIVSSEERLDVENARLIDLSTQLVAMQNATYDARARQEQVSAVREGRAPADSVPEVVQSNLIQMLKIDLARAQARQQDVVNRVGPNHPDYARASSEVASLQREIDGQINTILDSVTNSYVISHGRETELQGALNAQRDRILELREKRDPLDIQRQLVVGAQRNYDMALERLNDIQLESSVNQVSVALLTEATPPSEPSSPKILLNTLLALFVGTALGIGFALLAEFLDTRVRSRRDLEELLDVPLLGDLSKSAKKKKSPNRALSFFQHVGWNRSPA